MSKTLPQISVARVERTFRVEREMPREGRYSLRIHREIVNTTDGGFVISVSQKIDAYNEPITKTATRTATSQYLTACQSAKSISDLIAAEVAFYDALVAEADAEKAASDAAKAQG